MMRLLAALVLGFYLAACSSSSTAPSTSSTTPSTTPTSVAIAPSGAIVQTGGIYRFRAIVSPSGVSQDIAWSVAGAGCSGASCGTIDATGKYTAPATVPDPVTVTVTARSVVDSTKSADKTVTIILLSGPSRTFVFDHSLSNYVSDYTKNSLFILYDNGAFVLQYPTVNVNGGGYRGGYTESNGVIAFAWEGWNITGPWAATGTLKGNSLTVNYNPIMQATDFEDATYTLRP